MNLENEDGFCATGSDDDFGLCSEADSESESPFDCFEAELAKKSRCQERAIILHTGT